MASFNRRNPEGSLFLLGEKMKIEWPIWWCLEPAAQAALMQFQWDKYGYHLQIPPMPDFARVDTKLESLEEIGREMRKAPSRSRR